MAVENIQQLSSSQEDEVRAHFREKARTSTYFMGKAVLGFNDLTTHLHKDMCDWIDRPRIPGERRLHGIVPRDHLKTSVWTIAHAIRLIAENPQTRILLANETATNVQHFLSKIDSVFRRNVLFQWLFPEIIPDWGTVKRWNATEITVPRENDYPEATIEVIGVGGAVVSRHYKVIKLDDLVGKQASEEPETMKKTIDWYQYCESLLEHPMEDWIFNVGTPWGFNDLDYWIRKHEPYVDIFERGCYGEPGQTEGEPIWPERFSREALERLAMKYDTMKFSCMYLCKPRDPNSSSFNESDLRFYGWHQGNIVPEAGIVKAVIDPEQLTRYLRIDPAISEKPGSARSAIVVDGVHRDERVFLLDLWAERAQPSTMIEKAFELNDKWKPEAWGIEAVAYQRVLKPIIESECERRGIWVNVKELHPDTKDRKVNRIRGKLEPYVKKGLIWIHKTRHEKFLEEFREFPTGSTLDVIDAFAYGPDMWSKPLEDVDPREEEREFMWGTDRSAITGY
jgi:predicted phage terminase large subunit-like protein